MSKLALSSLAGALIFHAAAGKSHSYDFVALVDWVTMRIEPSCHISGHSFSSATRYVTRKQSPGAQIPILPLQCPVPYLRILNRLTVAPRKRPPPCNLAMYNSRRRSNVTPHRRVLTPVFCRLLPQAFLRARDLRHGFFQHRTPLQLKPLLYSSRLWTSICSAKCYSATEGRCRAL